MKMVGLDYQNPKIFPFIENYSLRFSNDDQVVWSLRSMTGSYFHVLNYALLFLPNDDHVPRHIGYSHWVNDPDMFGYLSRQNRLMFFAKNAVLASDKTFADICRLHLEKDVVMVDPAGKKDLFLLSGLKYVLRTENQSKDQWNYIVDTIQDGQVDLLLKISGWDGHLFFSIASGIFSVLIHRYFRGFQAFAVYDATFRRKTTRI